MVFEGSHGCVTVAGSFPAITLKIDDYFAEGKRWKLRLHEKGGKEHVVPLHHTLKEYLDAYIGAANIREQSDGPLFRPLTTAPGPPLSLEPMTQPDAWRMIRRLFLMVRRPPKFAFFPFRALFR